MSDVIPNLIVIVPTGPEHFTGSQPIETPTDRFTVTLAILVI